MSIKPLLMSICAASLLAGCLQTEEEIIRASDLPNAPDGTDPDACFGRIPVPAVIETVTEQVLVRPAQINSDGTIGLPATYKTETRQQIVRPRTVQLYEILCEEELTKEFVSSVQRALEARGLYAGAINGRMDKGTKAAIATYQLEQGLESELLSVEAAKRLGLVVVEIE